MLVLARRVGEQLVIDGQVHVTVLAVKNQTVRIGISAPAAVRIDRAEVHERRFQEMWPPAAADSDRHIVTEVQRK